MDGTKDAGTGRPGTGPMSGPAATDATAAGGDNRTPAAGKDEGGKDQVGRRRFRLALFIGIAVAVIALAALVWWLAFARGIEATDDAFIDAQMVRIAPQVSGQLAELDVDSNTPVKEGAVLARIDPAAPQAEMVKAQAMLAEAQGGLGTARAQVEQAASQVAEAQSALVAAGVKAANARSTADRLTGIRSQSDAAAVSQQEADDAVAAARAAEAMRDQAKTAVASAQAAKDAAQAGQVAAMAKVRSARAAIAAAQVVLDHLTLTAPANGQIVQVSVARGSFVQPGEQIMALVPDRVYVTANFKETQLADIRVGQPVDLTVDAYPDVAFKGRVVSIQRGAGQAFQLLPPQNATGNYVKVVQRVPVRIAIISPDTSGYVLGPGMSVRPRVRTGERAGE